MDITTGEIIVTLKEEIKKSPEACYCHRLHAVLLVSKGFSCQEISGLFGDAPRTIQYWVERFKNKGVEGLKNAKRSGRPSKLTQKQMMEIREAFCMPPSELNLDSINWDGKTLSEFIRKNYFIELGTRQCQRLYKQLAS